MSKKILNVLYTFDETYAPYAGISMTSLMENNKAADEINIYIIAFSVSNETMDKLYNAVNAYGRKLIIINQRDVEETIKKYDIPLYRGSYAAAARLFISDFIKDDVDRILYLDSDTLVTNSVLELCDIDLQGNPVGMILDTVAKDYKWIVGFKPEDHYYNSGVMLYDLKRWKELGCTDRIVYHVKNVRNKYQAPDQDLINIVLRGQIATLGPIYNYQPFHTRYTTKTYVKSYGLEGYYSKKEIDDARNSVAIHHTYRFLGMFPWNKDSIHPDVDTYNYYKELSVWSDTDSVKCPNNGFAFKVERILYKVLPDRMYLAIFRFICRGIYKRSNKIIEKSNQYKNI